MNNKLKLLLKSLSLLFILLFFSDIFFTILNIDSTIIDKKYIIYLSLSNLIVIIIFITTYYKTLLEDLKKLKENPKILLTSILYWTVGLILMVISNVIITTILNKTIPGNEKLVREMIKVSPLLMLIDASIYAPITEELVFRKSIKDVINNKYIFIITSGLIFGILHTIGHIHTISDIIHIIPYSVMGIALALIYQKTDNIYSSIIMHSFHNTLAIIIFLVGVSL